MQRGRLRKTGTAAPALARAAGSLYREIRAVLESARAGAYRAATLASRKKSAGIARRSADYS